MREENRMTDKEKKSEQDKLLDYLKDKYPNKDIEITHFFRNIIEKHKVNEQYIITEIYAKIDNYIEFNNYCGLLQYEKNNSNNTKAIAHLKTEGFNYLCNKENLELTRKLFDSTLDTNKSVKTTNIIQWIAAVLTIAIIGYNCLIDYSSYKITKSQADRLERISKEGSLDKLLIQKKQQSIIQDLKLQNDSLLKLVQKYDVEFSKTK